MKLFLVLIILSWSALAEQPSMEEHKRLLEENIALKEQLKNQQNPDPAQSKALMEKLQKGQRHMDESNKFLEELDKEE